MNKVIKALQERVKSGSASMLVTVAEGSGSTPAKQGASMAVGASGRICGTVGGGKLELTAIEIARELLENKECAVRRFGLNDNKTDGLGMACGGDATLLFTLIEADGKTADFLDKATFALNDGKTGTLLLPYDGGAAFIDASGNFISAAEISNVPLLPDLDLGFFEQLGRKYFMRRLSPGIRVHIFGAGHIARETVPLLSKLGFRCIVSDNREEYAKAVFFPDADEVRLVNYGSLAGNYSVNSEDYIIVATHGHAGDYDVEKYALTTPASYIGVMGSAAKTAKLNEMLKKDGFTDGDLKRVTTPIGVAIKSQTPEEIAVSIAAQLIERRASKIKKS